MTRPAAVVMNMFYTGLGIARSLGENGVPVIGLTSQRRVYGNFTHYARIIFCPDSRTQPEALLDYLLRMGEAAGQRNVIFPTRDDDVVFLDRFREQLEPYFILTVPEHQVVEACLNKWQTHQWAQQAKVPAPQCWLIEGEEDLQRAAQEVPYPCVLKPLASHHWRQDNNWQIVQGRKAIAISSREELVAEYAAIARADRRALVQELVPGSDSDLVIAACYLDRQSNWVAGFNTRKLVQVPEGFGTGCIVQIADVPELLETSARLLRSMRFTGIAEVEFKWDANAGQYKLIEINPRSWDQHRLGSTCGVDLVHRAYCDHAGLPQPPVHMLISAHKWIAEDAFLMAFLRLFLRYDPKAGSLLRLAKGKRIYAIWSFRDPLPFIAYLVTQFVPVVTVTGMKMLWAALRQRLRGEKPSPVYNGHPEKGKSHA